MDEVDVKTINKRVIDKSRERIAILLDSCSYSLEKKINSSVSLYYEIKHLIEANEKMSFDIIYLYGEKAQDAVWELDKIQDRKFNCFLSVA